MEPDNPSPPTASIADSVHPIRKSLFSESPHSASLYTSLPSNYRVLRAERNHTAAAAADANELRAKANASNYGTGGRIKQTSNTNKNNQRKSALNDAACTMMTSAQPYGILDESLPPPDHSFGLSNNLSTESIRNACEFYDDELSDDDLIEVQSTPECFQKQAPSRKSFTANCFHIEGRKKRKCSEENPLCALTLEHKNESIYANETETSTFTDDANECQQDDDQALTTVLDELDAMLDIHGGASSSLNTSSSSAGHDGGIETKIEDCLLDLDNYLKDMDDCSVSNFESDDIQSGHNTLVGHAGSNSRNRTLPMKRKTFPSAAEAGIGSVDDDAETSGRVFQRSHALRKTISCALENRTKDSFAEASQKPLNIWRRNSMRRTSPLALPIESTSHNNADHITSSNENCENDENACPAAAAGSSSAIAVNENNVLPQCNTQINILQPTVQLPVNSELRRCFSQNDFSTRGVSAASANEMLTQENIFNNLLAQNGPVHTIEDRPRQWGRRAEGHPRILSIRSDSSGENHNSCTIVNHDRRPMSAPATASAHADEHALRQERHTTFCTTLSEASSIRSSRNASPVSIISSSDSSSTAASTSGNMQTNLVGGEQLQAQNSPLDPENTQVLPRPGFNSEWPHGFSRTLALICCSVGLFNICRFAVLTVQYGGNFLLQFLLLSILFGIPLFWLQMCLGAKIKAGPVSMWKISPICRGIGIALVLVQCCIAIYSSVAISWLLVYLRDSFPSHTQAAGAYRWQETLYPYYRHATNASSNLTECVADYFNIVVLQRLKIAKRHDGSDIRFRVSDRLAFNLVILWAAVFLILCKGLRSYGKMIFPLFLLPLIAFGVVTGKLLTVVDLAKLQNIFAAADFDEFLINSKTWTAAAQEAFLTWGLLGPSVIAVSSRHAAGNRKTTLRRDAILVVLVTFLALSMAALFGLACIEILHQHSYVYAPGSFEQPERYTAVYSLKAPINANILSYPPKWVPHYSSFVGETYRRPTTLPHDESGYQALRLISELFPAAVALARNTFSWIWVAVTFATFTLFGLAQLCVMWKPISSALGNSTSSVLLSCVTGLLLSIPFATEMGISILHYMDLLLGGAWFIPILWTAQIFGVFLIRGRPYNGDDLVNDLRMSGSMSAFLALSWNVLLPIGLITLAVVDYKTSLSNQFYYWRGKSYFSYWARKLAGLTQIAFLLLIPITAIVQIYRYLTNGPSDILDRIQLLYRPSEDMSENRRNSARNREANGGRTQSGNTGANIDLNQHAQDDAPPKYTPPPSYTTATGARLAKILRQSIRRSVRRILGEPGRSRPILPIDTEMNQQSLPPDYSTVHTSPSGNIEAGNEPPAAIDTTDNAERPPSSNTYAQRSLSLGRKLLTQKQQQQQHSDDLTGRPSSASRTLERNLNAPQRLYTAEDVVTVLRSSTRRIGAAQREAAAAAATSTTPTSSELHSLDPQHENSFRSIENLILNAEPLDQSPAVGCDEAETSNTQNNTSVI